jgi:hypothetical protein
VSPLWRDEVGVHISADKVCLVRLGRGFKPRVTAEHEKILADRGSVSWSTALSAVDELLGKSEWQRAALRVVVADCWVRYAIVPWVADLRSTQERLTHGRQLLASIYGEAVSGWEVCLSEAPPGLSRVACAMPGELLTEIADLVARRGARLASLQPQLIFAYQNWRHCLPASGAWFVTIGDGTLTAARLSNGSWDRVHSVRIGSDWTRDLKRLQKFGRLASASAAEGTVYIDAPQAWREIAGPQGGDLHWLEADREPATTLQKLQRVRRLAA